MVRNLLFIVAISFNIWVLVDCVPPSCYVCNSATDENCKIINPDLVVDVQKECLTDFDGVSPEPTNLCYTLINGANVVRKCLIDEASPTFQQDCDKNPLCMPCNANLCNWNQVVPLECVTCNSTADPNCATLRQPIKTTEICELDEECFVGVDSDGITYRGCVSSTDSDKCSGALCQKCSNKDKCNDAIYPVDRLSCHQCNTNVGCNGEQNVGSGYPCVNYDEHDACYIIGFGLYAQRGCLSDLDDYSQNCTNHPDLCTVCNSQSDCNDQNAVVETGKSCYFCDEKNPYCYAHVNSMDDEAKVSSECKLFLNYEFACYTYTSDTIITRDCLNHVGRITQPECLENSVNCTICGAEMCNVDPKLENGDSCITCTSTDPNCNDPDNIWSLSKDCYSHPDKKGCYLLYDGVEERGCINDLEDIDKLAECKENHQTCKTCVGGNCNQKMGFTTCYECDSTVNATCIVEGAVSVLCEDYLDTCLVYVKEPGKTVRGCTNELNPIGDGVRCSRWNCNECLTNDCNGEFFPIDRLKCLNCASSIDPGCNVITETSAALYSVTCRNYVSDDWCYTIITGDNNVTRGCLSDQDAAALECPNSNRYCMKCSQNNCNTRELEYEPTLSCIQCDETDPKCEWGHREIDAQPCNETIFFDEQELCYVLERDGKVQRGCVLDDEQCLDDDLACTTCSSFGCNSFHVAQSQCIVCDSSDIEQKFCESEIEEGYLTVCSNGNQFYEHRGCYTYKTEMNVHRGCVSMLTETEFAFCKSAKNVNCDICYGEGCNNLEPNFASRLSGLSVLALVCILGLTKLLNCNLNYFWSIHLPCTPSNMLILSQAASNNPIPIV